MAWPQVYGLQASHFQRQQYPQLRPTILLVHDAFLAPQHYDELHRALLAAGERVLIPQLPSSSGTVSDNTFEVDVHTLIDHGKAEIDAGRTVVAVAHGYGAIPALMAAERLNQYSLNRPRAGHISKIVLIAGVALKPDQSWMEAVQPGWAYTQDGLVWVEDPENIFFQDSSINIRSQMVAVVNAQSEDSLCTPVASPGRVDVPIVYLICLLDNALAPALQNSFVRALQASNQRVSIVERRTGHCPFVSAPDDVANLIWEVVS